MPTSKKPRTRRLRKRRTSVSIGGVSQSAFAGYGHQAQSPNASQDSAKSGESQGDEKGEKKVKKKKNKDKDKGDEKDGPG